MEFNEFMNKLKGDPELAQNLKEALGRNAGAEEISGILAGVGIDTATIEAVLAEYQQKLGSALAVQELDDDELDKVAGGGTGNDCSSTDDCDRNFKYPLRSEAKRCDSSYFCDEYYKCDNDWSCTTTS